MTRLEPMSEEEFVRSFESGVARQTEEMVHRGLWSRGEAATAARSEMHELLPRGRGTPGFVFLRIVDERTGERVGETWYSTDTKGGRPHFWLHWLGIDPPYRRRGHARRTLELLTERAREAGADRVGLHVLADNRDALALYAAAGFLPSSHRLAKRL